jgi:hypothetical protein
MWAVRILFPVDFSPSCVAFACVAGTQVAKEVDLPNCSREIRGSNLKKPQ